MLNTLFFLFFHDTQTRTWICYVHIHTYIHTYLHTYIHIYIRTYSKTHAYRVQPTSFSPFLSLCLFVCLHSLFFPPKTLYFFLSIIVAISSIICMSWYCESVKKNIATPCAPCNRRLSFRTLPFQYLYTFFFRFLFSIPCFNLTWYYTPVRNLISTSSTLRYLRIFCTNENLSLSLCLFLFGTLLSLPPAFPRTPFSLACTQHTVAKGRTNIELREQFILADGVSQTMTAFRSKPSPTSTLQRTQITSTNTGPITKVRERSWDSPDMWMQQLAKRANREIAHTICRLSGRYKMFNKICIEFQ